MSRGKNRPRKAAAKRKRGYYKSRKDPLGLNRG